MAGRGGQAMAVHVGMGIIRQNQTLSIQKIMKLELPDTLMLLL